jgi:hypothetical protein
VVDSCVYVCFFQKSSAAFLLVHSSCVLLFGISCSSFEFGVLLPFLILFHSIIFFDSIHRRHSSSSSRSIIVASSFNCIFPKLSAFAIRFDSQVHFASTRIVLLRLEFINPSNQPFLIIHHHHLHVLAISCQSTYLFSRVPQAAIIYIGYPVPLFQFFSAFPLFVFFIQPRSCSRFVEDYNTSLSRIYNPYMLYAYNAIARQLQCACESPVYY